MRVVLVVVGIVAVLGVLSAVHWYVWRRMVRDTTRPGGAARRIGTAAVVALPLLSVGAMVSVRAEAPFALQQILAWPGYLWLATLLYLVLALIIGEAVRPILGRVLARRGPAALRDRTAPQQADPAAEPERAAEHAAESAREPAEAVTVGADGRPIEAPPGGVRDGRSGAGRETAPSPASDLGGSGDAAPEPALSRRLFVARTVAVGAAAVAAGTVGYGTYGVLRGPTTKRVTVPLAKLPRSAHGFRIAVVSDIHLSPVLGRAHAQRVVDAVNRTNADLVTIVGDMVDGSVENLGSAAEPLRGLQSRYGTFFVTGNHEYFSGAAPWVEHVRQLGMHPLENARVEMPGFDLAGVNDFAGEDEGQGPDFVRALGDRDRSRTSVLLAHQPVAIHDAVKFGVDLQLSGHTHGGQLWPGNFIAELDNPTVAGLERYGDTQLYVTRGAGAWGPPVRVGAPSDITVVQLASPAA
ncbi:metallophosphoesterase [Yinghuangia soli]|uniref:Metallophosphoesterase n=1 Tax=Yinghuangia soli TaxID=2908204 RepID=A0AA41Q2B6_9ACTN|nr:metallophosphoesterase [Yinghuangia soli]MCF2529640.1 metallophosphoesterase [Yinghuangia soli]